MTPKNEHIQLFIIKENYQTLKANKPKQTLSNPEAVLDYIFGKKLVIPAKP
jgi:hypothetical protein